MYLINSVTQDEDTPLHWGAASGNEAVVYMFISEYFYLIVNTLAILFVTPSLWDAAGVVVVVFIELKAQLGLGTTHPY